MLTDQELLALLEDAESDRVERKESASDTTKISEAVCALANDLPGHGLPGVIFIGVTDKGEPKGLDITDKMLSQLGGIRSDGNVLPPPTLSVGTVKYQGRLVIALQVEPSTDPPVRYRGRVWGSRGSSPRGRNE